MGDLFDEFPNLRNEKIEIRKRSKAKFPHCLTLVIAMPYIAIYRPFCITRAKNFCKPPSRILVAEILTTKR